MNWASKMIEALRGKDETDETLFIARLVSASPVTIEIAGQAISRNLFVNPALLVDASDTIDLIERHFENAPAPPELFNFLKSYHQNTVLKHGDILVVVKQGTSFYVIAKVAKL